MLLFFLVHFIFYESWLPIIPGKVGLKIQFVTFGGINLWVGKNGGRVGSWLELNFKVDTPPSSYQSLKEILTLFNRAFAPWF